MGQGPEATCAMVPADGAADLASVVVGWSPGVVAALKPSGSRTAMQWQLYHCTSTVTPTHSSTKSIALGAIS